MREQSLSGSWHIRQVGGDEWITGAVPGDVHTALLAAGRIPDPYVGDNEKQLLWVSETDWEYRRMFTPDPLVLNEEKVYLVCDGLDTLADVYLNGKHLAHTDNMYRQYSFEVKNLLKEGENEIRVVFGAPLTFTNQKQKEMPMIGGGDILGGPHLRKAPYHFGWDWGPRLPPIGIWKDVRLEAYSAARMSDVHLRQKSENGKVTVWVEVEIAEWTTGDRKLQLRITSPDGEVQETVVSVKESKSAAVEIENPQLWWPNGYGEQPLYQVEVALLVGRKALDQRHYQIGLRTVEIRQQPDQWGESFTFVINGVPIFAKGADWIPADYFTTRISDELMEGLLRSSVQAHMNMLRVWGGGLYEEDRFYDLCDRYGILVWQDFTFACGIYPADEAFHANVREEAIQNVRRLRHHTSLAMWCGNNEMEQGWVEWGWNKPQDADNQRLKAGYDRMFHHMLPEVVAANDPDHFYWPSSASSNIAFSEPSSQARGDCHYWDVWHGRKPFTAYRSQFPRFMSEFGFQALPPFETIKTFAEPKDWNMTSYIMEHHQRSGSGNGLMIGQMTDTFRMPRDFASLVYLSMILQAEGIRYGVEHWRRNMNRVSGTLIWQLNDCWQVASWASLDYFGRWKALHYAAKRFYEPLMLSVEDTNTVMAVHVTSDLMTATKAQVKWRLEELDGKVLEQGEQAVTAAPLADTPVVTLDFAAKVTDANKRRTIFVAELWQGDRLLTSKVSLFAANKHLELVDPELKVVVHEEQGQLIFEVTAKTLARFVELSVEGADLVFSDNYFDIPAGQTVSVMATMPRRWNENRVRKATRVRSLYQSY